MLWWPAICSTLLCSTKVLLSTMYLVCIANTNYIKGHMYKQSYKSAGWHGTYRLNSPVYSELNTDCVSRLRYLTAEFCCLPPFQFQPSRIRNCGIFFFIEHWAGSYFDTTHPSSLLVFQPQYGLWNKWPETARRQSRHSGCRTCHCTDSR